MFDKFIWNLMPTFQKVSVNDSVIEAQLYTEFLKTGLRKVAKIIKLGTYNLQQVWTHIAFSKHQTRRVFSLTTGRGLYV